MTEIIKSEEMVLVRPGQNVVASMAKAFAEEVKAVVREFPKSIVIDLEGIEMMDSMGISSLLTIQTAYAKQGKTIKVINISDNIYKLLKNMRIETRMIIERAGS